MNSDFESYHFDDFISDESFQQWARAVADPGTTQWWNERYQQHPELRPVMDQAKAAIQALSRTEPEVDKATIARAWSELEERIETPVRPMPVMRWLSYAAVLGIVLIGTWLLIDNTPSEVYVSYHAGYGEKKEVLLPDGTHVTLNANSTLKVPASWEGGRKVWLEKGEAFFVVTKTTDQQRFIVHADGLDITVLGTQFNVNQRTEMIRVLLAEGKISLSTPDEERILSPGDMAVYSTHSRSLIIDQVDISRHDSWLRNKIVFDNTALSEVADMLNAHYGVAVTLAENLKDKRVSGEIPNDNLDLLLKALQVALDLHISHNGNEVRITNHED